MRMNSEQIDFVQQGAPEWLEASYHHCGAPSPRNTGYKARVREHCRAKYPSCIAHTGLRLVTTPGKSLSSIIINQLIALAQKRILLYIYKKRSFIRGRSAGL